MRQKIGILMPLKTESSKRRGAPKYIYIIFFSSFPLLVLIVFKGFGYSK